MGHGLDAGPGAARRQILAQDIGIVGSIAEQDVALPERGQHVDGSAAVMGLAFGQPERDRQATGIDKRMDFGGQAAPRATHATGSIIFFWVLEAC